MRRIAPFVSSCAIVVTVATMVSIRAAAAQAIPVQPSLSAEQISASEAAAAMRPTS